MKPIIFSNYGCCISNGCTYSIVKPFVTIKTRIAVDWLYPSIVIHKPSYNLISSSIRKSISIIEIFKRNKTKQIFSFFIEGDFLNDIMLNFNIVNLKPYYTIGIF